MAHFALLMKDTGRKLKRENQIGEEIAILWNWAEKLVLECSTTLELHPKEGEEELMGSLHRQSCNFKN